MKTQAQVIEYFKDKSYTQTRGLFIAGFIKGSGLSPIKVPLSFFGNNTTTEFIEWFKSEDNSEDIIEEEGKKYQFIEGTYECCGSCSLK